MLALLLCFAALAQAPKTGKDSLYHHGRGKKIYTVSEVDTMARYKPGVTAMMKFIASNLKYPEADREKGIGGKAIASFVVEKNGKIKDIIIIKRVSPAIDAEVKRVLKLLPKEWKPAIKDGKAVRSQFIIPISVRAQ